MFMEQYYVVIMESACFLLCPYREASLSVCSSVLSARSGSLIPATDSEMQASDLEQYEVSEAAEGAGRVT